MKGCPTRVIRQRHDWDCGVACLAMLLDKDYGDIAAAVKRHYPVIPRRGLGLYHLEHLTRMESNHRLRRIYKSATYLLDHSLGILGLNGGSCNWAGHWVIWKSGVIIEPSHEKRPVWSLEDYLKDSKSRTATLLVLED